MWYFGKVRPKIVRSKPTSSIESPKVAVLPSALHAALVVSWVEANTVVEARIGAQTVHATLDPAVAPAVIETALRTGERILVQPEGDRWIALGALRTQVTPGVDQVDEVTIRARRLKLEGTDEIQLVSSAASLVMRVTGAVETIAREVTVRATGVHKLIGRVLHLN